MEKMKQRQTILWLFLFLVVFLNGFEAGGYQASILTIGKDYDLNFASMGIFASIELFATMLAPLLLGNWADRSSKTRCIRILLGLQIVASLLILCFQLQKLFIVGVFFLGLTTSALQFISIAALADSYPLSGKRKIGFITSVYALGALVSPLIIERYLRLGFHWKTLFLLLAIGSLFAFLGICRCNDEPQELHAVSEESSENENTNHFVLTGILALCVIMCIYVGFENGFAYFVESFFQDILSSQAGRFALSIFWASMIPSRLLVGFYAKKRKLILFASILTIPVVTVILSHASNSVLVLCLCVLLGFASGAIYPCVLTIMLSFSGKRTATATGMITTATGIGGVLFTSLTGFMSERFGLQIAMMILASFFLLSFLAALLAQYLSRKVD